LSTRLLFKLLAREVRGARARLVPFLASLAIGVAAVVLVAGLGDSVSRAIRMEARPLLGADVAARSGTPLPASVTDAAAAFPDVQRVDTVDLLTMVALPPGPDGAPGRSLMAELKAVSPGWPFYGVPTVAPNRPLAELLDDAGVVVEPNLLERLGIGVGDTLRVGGAAFTVRGAVEKEPGRLPGGMVAGPRVLISLDGLARAGLGDSGARITYRALFRTPDEARAGALAERLSAGGPASGVRVETWSDAQPNAQAGIRRSTAYMGLVALLSLVVGGVGVAQSTRAWMARRLDAMAVQRCLGMTTRELAAVALLQTALLALVGSTVGAALGVLGLVFTPLLLGDLVPPGAVQPWQPAAMARGIALGVGVALLFAAQPLAQAASVPPLRVLRRDVEPLPPSRFRTALGALAVGGGIFGLAWVQSADPVVAAAFAGGLGVVAGVGTLAARATAAGLGRAAHRVRRWWLRHGLAAVGRPGAGLVPAAVSLAIGVVVVLTTVLVEGRIFAQIAEEFPKNAPSAFVLDVQPDQREGVAALLERAGAERLQAAPMVVARLLSVNGRTVESLAAERPEEDRWPLTREQRLSYMPALPAGNVIVAGQAFSDAVPAELSLEQRYADDLGATVGSELTFDVQGVPITLTVTSLRTVSWETFDMNFFLIAEPGVLDAAPQTVLLTTQLDAAREPAVQDSLAAAYPNVTLVSVRAALTQARGLLERLGWGIRAVGAFTALAGIAILASGVAADAARQGRTVALLKTLGTTRAGVVGIFAVEYGLVGLLAGVLGAAGALGVSWAVVTRMMRLAWRTDVPVLVGAVLATAVLTAVVGVLANTRALRVRPSEVLRGE